MPPVEPLLEAQNNIRIDDSKTISDNNNPSGDPLYVPPVGNEALLKEQEDEEEALNTGAYIDTSVVDEVNAEIENEVGEQEDEKIEDENDKDRALNEVTGQVQNAIDQVNMSIETLDQGGMNHEADDARNAATELNRIQSSMQEIRGLNFTAVPIKEQKQGFFSKFWNRTTSLFGKIGKLAVNIATAPVAIYKYVSANNTLAKAREKMQQSRNPDLIPGWNGALFERPENERGEDMIYDERRVPIVWSYPIAARAETDENGQKVPAPPEVAIMVHQPTPGSSASMNGPECGHVMLGITYTRYSNVTKRNERYLLKYGFYPAGGLTKWSYTGTMFTLDAMLPGQLMSDRTTEYSISKRYPATMAQVGRILKESEHYAQGGYSYYSRNCTTFVRDMTVNVGQIISDGDAIFSEAEVRYDAVSGLGKIGFGAIETYSNASAKNNMAELADKDDLSYQNFGNKRLTQEDVDRYKKSVKNPVFTKRTLIPALVGENLRMNKGGKGIISSYEHTGNGKKVSDATSIGVIYGELKNDAKALAFALNDLLTDDDIAALPENLRMLVGNMQYIGIDHLQTALELIDKRYVENGAMGDIKVHEYLTDIEILNTRINMSDESDLLSELYYTYLKGDKRLNTLVMNTLSQIQRAVTMLDAAYRDRLNSKLFQTEGDLGNVGARLNTGEVTLVIPGKGDCKNIFLPATVFEAYLQLYNFDIERLLRDYVPFIEVSAIPAKRRTNAQKSTYKRLKNVFDRAKPFVNAHRYMLERKSYTQQDINYAMNLAMREQSYSEASGSYLEGKTSGAIYQQVIFDKVFGGISTAMKDGISPENLNGIKTGAEEEILGAVKLFDDYFTKSIRSNTDLVKMILNSLSEITNKKYGGILKPDEIRGFVSRDFFEILRMYIDAVIEAHISDKFFYFMKEKITGIMERFKITSDVLFFRELEAMI
jgi:hypothetical protein